MLIDHLHLGADPAAIGAPAAAAEQAGLAGWFTTETTLDPAIAVTLAAGATTRITVGTAITIAFSRNPMTVAYTAHGLQRVARGRYVLGLGSQVPAHVRRRFGMPWSAPVPRMREFVAAYHAIWDAWEHGGPLDFAGEHYRHTLMPPAFRPDRLEWPRPPVWLGAVGGAMAALAGEVADGVIGHFFSTPRYLREVVGVRLAEGAARTGRDPSTVVRAGSVLAVTGDDERAMVIEAEHVRREIGFYAATPAYRPVLERHGWAELGDEAQRLVRAGRWDDLPRLVDDTVLGEFAVVAPPADLGRAVRERYTGLLDRVALVTRYRFGPGELLALAAAVHETPVSEGEG